MATALTVFVVDLAIFLFAMRVMTAPSMRYSTATQTVVLLLLGYLVVLGTVWFKPDAWALPTVVCAAAFATIVLPGEGLSRLTDALGRHRLLLYILSTTAVAALVFILLPIRTFQTSPGELTVHLDYLLSVNARHAMTLVYAAALLYSLALTPRMRTALSLVAVGTLALALVYAFVLPFGYPAMTGLQFEGETLSSAARGVRLLCDAMVIVAVAAGLRAVLLSYGARPLVLTVALVTVSLVGTAAVDIRNDVVGGAGGAEAGDASAERPLRFSTTHPNSLVIFLDRFMGSYVESALATHPQLSVDLAGFTWYPRTVSAGENSIAGVHPMLGGYDYVPEAMNARGRSLLDLSVEAFSILPYNFAKQGYGVNVVNPRGLGFTMEGDCSFLAMDGVYCGHIPDAVARRRAASMGFPMGDLTASNYTDLLVLLGSMRAAPFGLKETLRNNRDSWRQFMDHSAGTTFTQWAELNALSDLTDAGAAASNFNFVSNILPHEPYYLGDTCLPQRARFEVSADELRQRGHPSQFSLQHANAAECTLLIVAEYLRHLQTIGVYDNTTIVVVSDHGIVGDIQDRSTRAVAGGTEDDLFVRTRSLLLVKERGASGPLRTSEAFVPNAEVPRIICEDIGGCVNPHLGNKPIEVMGRNDPFVVSMVPWQFTRQQPDAFVIQQQLVLTGKDPFNVNGWKAQRPSGAR